MEIRILRGAEVKALLPMGECIALMRKTMIAVSEGRATVPLRQVMALPNGEGLMGAMPGYLADPHCFGLKLVSIFPHNVAAGLSSHLGLVLLFEPEHGRPVALLDAAEITAIRTAAVSGLATQLLARDDAGDLALLGAGEQAHSHLAAMAEARPLRRVRIWSRSREKAETFAQTAGARHGLTIEVEDSVKAAVDGADLICAVSAARAPILMGDWIAAGAHVNAVGASQANAAEIDTAAVVRARMFVDLRESADHEAGEYLAALNAGAIAPDHILAEIGEVASGARPGRLSPDDITLFKSLGIAAEDLAAAHFILEQARAKGVGQVLDF